MSERITELRTCWPLLVGLALLSPRLGLAELSVSAFETANQLYGEGKYAQAAAAYENLLKSGQGAPAIYFNLGNAFFKAEQFGRAIAAYRKAEALTPRDPDVRANLQFARNQVQGPTFSPAAWQRWFAKLSLNEWTVLASASVWLCLLLLILGQWRPALRPDLSTYVVLSGILAALVCACLVTEFYQGQVTQTAIVVAREAGVRQTPFPESNIAFTLHDGAELRVLDQKNDWLQVTTDSRRIGWLPRDQVLLRSGT